MLNWVVKLEPTFPNMVKISDDLKDLISKCLEKVPKDRIGYEDITKIRDHPWF